ncbi:hypothetical protein CAEBREN_15132 [Caenorhabditis brenneri]|uniref:Uncharacterized protein n=1 Tax=Caenorhabditis brenneri TaxID=135651 RepID=G0NQU7_CAEBE|nr:hypothetical protein CAEBREN_15132 [Caenorhabditis brenneri]
MSRRKRIEDLRIAIPEAILIPHSISSDYPEFISPVWKMVSTCSTTTHPTEDIWTITIIVSFGNKSHFNKLLVSTCVLLLIIFLQWLSVMEWLIDISPLPLAIKLSLIALNVLLRSPATTTASIYTIAVPPTPQSQADQALIIDMSNHEWNCLHIYD